jgi:hypothetical protein
VKKKKGQEIVETVQESEIERREKERDVEEERGIRG